jgi:hypothetical protein
VVGKRIPGYVRDYRHPRHQSFPRKKIDHEVGGKDLFWELKLKWAGNPRWDFFLQNTHTQIHIFFIIMCLYYLINLLTYSTVYIIIIYYILYIGENLRIRARNDIM